jgi:hypothetical protein
MDEESMELLCIFAKLSSCYLAKMCMKNSNVLLKVFLFLALPALTHCGKPTHTGLPDAFQGVWVKTSYLEKLASTRSPFLAWEELTDVASMHIVLDSLHTLDSVRVTVNWNNHEGYELILYARPGRLKGSWQAAFAFPPSDGSSIELGLEADALVLYTYERNGDLLHAVRYRKVMEEPLENDGVGLQTAVNQMLFAGPYTILENNQPVYMSADGSIDGLEEAVFYHASTDFMITLENNFDLIELVREGLSTLRYHYVFSYDTLQLYEVIPDEDSVYYLRGQPVYHLRKAVQ